MKITRVVTNKAQCAKCKDIIESKHTHSFVTCKCGAISVDGGKDYLRRVGDIDNFIELSEAYVEEYTPSWEKTV